MSSAPPEESVIALGTLTRQCMLPVGVVPALTPNVQLPPKLPAPELSEEESVASFQRNPADASAAVASPPPGGSARRKVRR